MVFSLSKLLILFFHLFILASNAQSSFADKAFMNLGDHDFELQPSVSLDGDWMVKLGIWNPLDNSNIDNARIRFEKLPQVWSGAQAFGAKTYSVRIRVPEARTHYSLLITEPLTSAAVYVDNRLYGKLGEVSVSKDTSKPQRGNIFFTFFTEKDEFQLTVQVSNYHYAKGGVWNSIKLSKSDYGLTQQQKVLFTDSFIFGSIVFIGIYHLVLYFNRRTWYSALFLAAFCFAIAIRYSSNGPGNILFLYFDDLPWLVQRNLEIVVSFIAPITFVLFLKFVYSKDVPIQALKGSVFVTLLLFFSLFFLSTEHMLLVWQLSLSLWFAPLIFYVMWQVYKHRRFGIETLFLGVFFLVFATLWDVGKYLFEADVPDLNGIGTLLFIVFQSFLLGKIFSSSFTRIEEKNKEIYKLNEELKVYINQLDELVMIKTRKIRSILATIRQGICTIEDSNLTIGEERSLFLNTIFGEDLREGNFIEALFKDGNLPPDRISRIRETLNLSIGQDEFQFSVNSHNLPAELKIEKSGKQSQLEIDWQPILNDRNMVSSILVAIRDVSELKKLEKDRKESQKKFRLINQILDSGLPQFNRVVKAIENHMNDIRKVMEIRDNPELLRKEIFIHAHTVKGLARSNNLDDITNLAHEMENYLSELESESFEGTILNLIDKIDANTQECLAIEILLEEKVGEHSYSLSIDLIKQIYLIISNAKLSVDERVLTTLRDIIFIKLENIVREGLSNISSLAKSCNKSVPKVDIKLESVYLDMKIDEVLLSCFSHLIGNSLDHGIENSERRLEEQKDPIGRIEIVSKLLEQDVVIFYSDDGSGIDFSKVHRKAASKGLIGINEQLKPQEIAELLLHQGFSTKEEVTEISGRGVGLSAVRTMLEKHGGRFEILLEKPNQSVSPLKFRIQVPRVLV